MRSVLCETLTAEQAEELAAAMIPFRAGPGTLVCREGEKPVGLMLLVRGTVEVFKQTATGSTQHIARVTAPTIIGEMGLLTDGPRTASVRTDGECEFYLLTRAHFERLVDAESLAAYKLIATVANVLVHRLEMMNQRVIELSEQQHRSLPIEALARLGEHVSSDYREQRGNDE